MEIRDSSPEQLYFTYATPNFSSIRHSKLLQLSISKISVMEDNNSYCFVSVVLPLRSTQRMKTHKKLINSLFNDFTQLCTSYKDKAL